MNKKEVGEIRRRFRRERSNITAIYGCYVRADKQIISEFKASMGMLPENEADKYMSLFKKTLAGDIGKKLNNITFTTKQVAEHEPRYQALLNLRQQALQDKEARHDFYQKIIDAISLDTNYLILLACDTYDVPFKNKNDEAQNDAGNGECFTYLICSICPVKETKPNLHYVHDEAVFHDGGMIQAVNSPALGFLFPAFDDRSTNLYGALYFNKDTLDAHKEFVDAVFGVVPIRAADEEKHRFNDLLISKLGDECSIDVIQQIHEEAKNRLLLHAEAKIADPLTVDKKAVQEVLTASGVPCETVSEFGKAFDEAFGAGAEVNLQNLVDIKHYTVTAPDVAIKIAPEKAQNIEMRTIGGLNYILVLADGDVEVNGIRVAPPSSN